MTDPTENEEINEELSSDELKGVSGGLIAAAPNPVIIAVSPSRREGSGFGGTLKDWKIANKNGINLDLPDTSSGVY